MPDSDEYQVGCDCIPGFASNSQGYCIDETQCNLWEAFGTLIGDGAVHSSDNSASKKQKTQSIDDQEKSQQFYQANNPAEISDQSQDEKIQAINSNSVKDMKLNGMLKSNFSRVCSS